MDREERRLKRQQDTKSAAIVMAVLAVILIVDNCGGRILRAPLSGNGFTEETAAGD